MEITDIDILGYNKVEGKALKEGRVLNAMGEGGSDKESHRHSFLAEFMVYLCT